MAPGSNHDCGARIRAGTKPLERFHANAFAPLATDMSG